MAQSSRGVTPPACILTIRAKAARSASASKGDGAVERGNANLERVGEGPLPHLTPHSCRRTFASIRYALGASPAEVMAELGHTNPSLALSVYAQRCG